MGRRHRSIDSAPNECDHHDHAAKEEVIKGHKFTAAASLIFVLISIAVVPQRARVQDNKTPYPNMAALDKYLMGRDAEIAVARSAAPDAVSRNAKVLVLGPHGYETAVEGKHGFVCLVERAWTSPFNSPEFWNPKTRSRVPVDTS